MAPDRRSVKRSEDAKGRLPVRISRGTRVDIRRRRPYGPPPVSLGFAMKVVNSLKSMKGRHKNCRIVRRKGRVYVINKTNPRFKARQG